MRGVYSTTRASGPSPFSARGGLTAVAPRPWATGTDPANCMRGERLRQDRAWQAGGPTSKRGRSWHAPQARFVGHPSIWSTASPKPWQRVLKPAIPRREDWPQAGLAEARLLRRGPTTANCGGGRSPRMILAGMRGVWGAEGGPLAPHDLSGENALSPLRPPQRARAPQGGIHPPKRVQSPVCYNPRTSGGGRALVSHQQ
jgi:hypothetical protein